MLEDRRENPGCKNFSDTRYFQALPTVGQAAIITNVLNLITPRGNILPDTFPV